MDMTTDILLIFVQAKAIYCHIGHGFTIINEIDNLLT